MLILPPRSNGGQNAPREWGSHNGNVGRRESISYWMKRVGLAGDYDRKAPWVESRRDELDLTLKSEDCLESCNATVYGDLPIDAAATPDFLGGTYYVCMRGGSEAEYGKMQ